MKKIVGLGKLVALSFQAARAKYPEVSEQWKSISYRIGGRIPASLLLVTIQRDGEVDVLLRAIEDEFSEPTKVEDDVFQSHYLNLISTYWIGSVYEVFRLLRERQLADDADLCREIFRDLELLRITLEKHEIAKDKMLKEPIALHRVPPNKNESDAYLYDPEGTVRAHIMPMGISSRGSIMWQATDLRGGRSVWIERRLISDRIIDLWGKNN